jgi:hypothetical protein
MPVYTPLYNLTSYSFIWGSRLSREKPPSFRESDEIGIISGLVHVDLQQFVSVL